MDIREFKKVEMQEIIDFYYHIKEYEYIFHLDSKLLDEPFNKIIENINIIKEYMNTSWSI